MRKSSFGILFISLFVLLWIAGSISCQAEFKPSVKGKKFIASGHHMPDARYIRDHVSEMEKMPFDGLIFGWYYPFFPSFRGQQGSLADFVENVKATKFTKFTDNFLGVECGNDGTFDWFDDARCKDLIDSWQMLARAAKQSGMKGIKFDPECYEGNSPFIYGQFISRSTKTPEEYERQIEKVASQIMEAINKEYPDITLLLYFGPSTAGYPRNLKAGLGMLPAFYDGMVKAAKPGFKMVDGYEQAYGFRTEKDYSDARSQMLENINHSAYPSKYRKHVQVGFSFWPDQMAGSPMLNRRSFNADILDQNFYVPDEVAYAENNALRYSDEYVWMWAESLDIWNSRIRVYNETGSFEYKPFPASYIDAMARAKTGVVPVPPKRLKGRLGALCSAKDMGEIDDDKVFGDLWTKYNEIEDLPLNWKFLPDPDDKGTKAGYYMTGYDDFFWPTIRIRELWDQQGFVSLTKYGWYRINYKAPETEAGKKLFLAFGAVDEAAYVYVNGKLAGFHDIEPEIGYIERFTIDVTKLLKPGQVNVIAVKVKNILGVGGIWRGVKLISEK